MFITIKELADFRLGRAATTAEDFEEALLPIFGGCVGCGASIAAYNACPTTSGFIACKECTNDVGYGYSTVQEADKDLFRQEEAFSRKC